jgi:hypothetical protein
MGLKKSNPQSPGKGRTAGTTRPRQEVQGYYTELFAAGDFERQ